MTDLGGSSGKAIGYELRLQVVDQEEGREVVFHGRSLVLAAYTGRDQATVKRHILELAREGITPPARTPVFYGLPLELLSTTDEVPVNSDWTSGEAEPVLFCTEAAWFLGVGSDHTARKLERIDIQAAKRACPKPISRQVFSSGYVDQHWSDLVLRCWVGPGQRLYQEAPLSTLLDPRHLLAAATEETGKAVDGLVLFLGTVPLLTESFLFEDRWYMEIVGGDGRAVSCGYHITKEVA